MWVTDLGIQYLALTAQENRDRMSPHNQLVARVADMLLRDGRLVWTGLSLRAYIQGEEPEQGKWRMCMPDVFSIRNTTVPGYLEPIVHEIKVSRADLLVDLKNEDKRRSYLELGGQCWYVLGCKAKGKPIAEAEEVPDTCGVMQEIEGRLEVVRVAPKRPSQDLPFHVWMNLAKVGATRA